MALDGRPLQLCRTPLGPCLSPQEGQSLPSQKGFQDVKYHNIDKIIYIYRDRERERQSVHTVVERLSLPHSEPHLTRTAVRKGSEVLALRGIRGQGKGSWERGRECEMCWGLLFYLQSSACFAGQCHSFMGALRTHGSETTGVLACHPGARRHDIAAHLLLPAVRPPPPCVCGHLLRAGRGLRDLERGTRLCDLPGSLLGGRQGLAAHLSGNMWMKRGAVRAVTA